MGTLEQELFDIIKPLCDEDRLFLDDVSLLGGMRNRLIKIIVDTEAGVTLAQCQSLSKKISDLFFRKDMFQGDYRLEVSSPGVNRPLKKAFEFRRSIGKDLTVNFRIEGEMQSVSGQLCDFDGDTIILKNKKEEISISLDDIEEARIKLKW
jgi:ribosome maturation factor RimP